MPGTPAAEDQVSMLQGLSPKILNGEIGPEITN